MSLWSPLWTRQSADIQGSIQPCSKSLSDRTLPFPDYQVMKAGWWESPCLRPPESIRSFAELPGPGLRAERSFVLCLFPLHSTELRGTSKQTKPKPFYSDNPCPRKNKHLPSSGAAKPSFLPHFQDLFNQVVLPPPLPSLPWAAAKGICNAAWPWTFCPKQAARTPAA